MIQQHQRIIRAVIHDGDELDYYLQVLNEYRQVCYASFNHARTQAQNGGEVSPHHVPLPVQLQSIQLHPDLVHHARVRGVDMYVKYGETKAVNDIVLDMTMLDYEVYDHRTIRCDVLDVTIPLRVPVIFVHELTLKYNPHTHSFSVVVFAQLDRHDLERGSYLSVWEDKQVVYFASDDKRFEPFYVNLKPAAHQHQLNYYLVEFVLRHLSKQLERCDIRHVVMPKKLYHTRSIRLELLVTVLTESLQAVFVDIAYARKTSFLDGDPTYEVTQDVVQSNENTTYQIIKCVNTRQFSDTDYPMVFHELDVSDVYHEVDMDVNYISKELLIRVVDGDLKHEL